MCAHLTIKKLFTLSMGPGFVALSFWYRQDFVRDSNETISYDFCAPENNKSFFLDFSDYMLFKILGQSYTQDFPESITLVSYSGNFSVNICDVHSIMAASLEIYIYTYTKCLWSGRCHGWRYNFMLKLWNLFYNSRLSWNHIKFQFLLRLHLPSFTKHIIYLGPKALSIFAKLSTIICVCNPSHWLKSPPILLKLKCYRFLRKPRLISLWN